MARNFQSIFDFPRNYEVKLLQAAPPIHPVEKLHHFPVELEEGERAGVYVRVEPGAGTRTAWTGFFAEGFESDQALNAICSCPDPDSFCTLAGGYAYIVKADDAGKWFRVEQRPVTDLRMLPERELILFAGFTSITALGPSGIRWTTERLSWEGITIAEIIGERLCGLGWDAIANKEVRFEVDLNTGRHTGGARPKTGRSE